MARAPRFHVNKIDVSAVGAWLRSQLPEPRYQALIAVVLSLLGALVARIVQLTERVLARRTKPPSERLRAVEKQLAFRFGLPGNDVVPTAPVAPVAPCAEATESAGDDEAPTLTPEQEAEAQEEAAAKAERKERRKRKPAMIPPDMARRPVENPVPPDRAVCPDCAVPMNFWKVQCSSYFELVLARFEHVTQRNEVVACPHCDKIVCAAGPHTLLTGGKCGPVLVAETLYNKLVNSMPIDRQARHYQRMGAPILPGMLGRSVAALLDLMVPLAERIKKRVDLCERMQLDATGLRVLDKTQPTGTWRDTLWVLIGDGKWLSYHALEKGDATSFEVLIAEAEAESFQCDGGTAMNGIETRRHRCRPGCHAHCRRKLVEAARRGDLRACEPLRWYSVLFRLEHEADRAKLTTQQREVLRQEHSWPVLERLRAWALALAPGVEPKSPLGEALTYMQNQWLRLCVFVVRGELELTNNISERALRGWVLGQVNWLFVSDQINAVRWCAGFSLVQTAIAHGLDPRAYLHAITKLLIPGYPRQRLDDLLPDAMLRAHPELADPLRRAREGPEPKVPETPALEAAAASAA